MSKGIAIQTILYLLLGILVVGIVVYLVYTYTTGPGLDINKCRSLVTNWCSGCMIAGWIGKNDGSGFGSKKVSDDVGVCIKNYFSSGNFGTKWPVDCNMTNGGTVAETKTTFCKQFTG